MNIKDSTLIDIIEKSIKECISDNKSCDVLAIEFENYIEETSEIDMLTITVDYENYGENIAYLVRKALDKVSNEYNITFNKILLEL